MVKSDALMFERMFSKLSTKDIHAYIYLIDAIYGTQIWEDDSWKALEYRWLYKEIIKALYASDVDRIVYLLKDKAAHPHKRFYGEWKRGPDLEEDSDTKRWRAAISECFYQELLSRRGRQLSPYDVGQIQLKLQARSKELGILGHNW